MPSRVLCLLALASLSMIGCGSNQPRMRASDAPTVTVKDFEFSPATLTVPAGTTVVWRFEGPTPHSTTSDAGSKESWNSGVLGPGKTFSHPFKNPGSYSYHCDPHPYMKGTIVVK